jgi:release factor glutamine methyltransferase
MDEIAFLLREKYNGIESTAFLNDVTRLNGGEPLAYVIGWIPFLDCRVYLDSRPLIPRTETEHWVELAINEINERYAGPSKKILKVLDLFSGSGCIGVAVLKHIPHAIVDFGELEERHVSTIRRNIHENDIELERTRIIQSDVWNSISDVYDVILANPPYLSVSRAHQVQDSVHAFEPASALYSNDDGFGLIQRTLEGLSAHLAEHGFAYIEHEPEQGAHMVDASIRNGLTCTPCVDQYGIVRYSVVRRQREF